LRGTGGRQNPFELDVRDDVLRVPKAEFAALRAVEGVKPGREHHGADVEFQRLGRLVV